MFFFLFHFIFGRKRRMNAKQRPLFLFFHSSLLVQSNPATLSTRGVLHCAMAMSKIQRRNNLFSLILCELVSLRCVSVTFSGAKAFIFLDYIHIKSKDWHKYICGTIYKMLLLYARSPLHVCALLFLLIRSFYSFLLFILLPPCSFLIQSKIGAFYSLGTLRLFFLSWITHFKLHLSTSQCREIITHQILPTNMIRI